MVNIDLQATLTKLEENHKIRIIDSDFCKGLVYGIRDGHLIIFTRSNGNLTVKLDLVDKLAAEIGEIAELERSY